VPSLCYCTGRIQLVSARPRRRRLAMRSWRMRVPGRCACQLVSRTGRVRDASFVDPRLVPGSMWRRERKRKRDRAWCWSGIGRLRDSSVETINATAWKRHSMEVYFVGTLSAKHAPWEKDESTDKGRKVVCIRLAHAHRHGVAGKSRVCTRPLGGKVSCTLVSSTPAHCRPPRLHVASRTPRRSRCVHSMLIAMVCRP